MAVRRYRYQMTAAAEAGIKLSPRAEIRRIAPDAHDFQNVEPLADCWLFSSPEIEDLPDYIVDISGEL